MQLGFQFLCNLLYIEKKVIFPITLKVLNFGFLRWGKLLTRYVVKSNFPTDFVCVLNINDDTLRDIV